MLQKQVNLMAVSSWHHISSMDTLIQSVLTVLMPLHSLMLYMIPWMYNAKYSYISSFNI